MIVSFIEIWCWIAYAAGYNLMLRKWLEFTYYSMIWLIPGWLFALIEMTAQPEAGGLAMNTNALYYGNSAFLFGMGFVLWIYIAGIHIGYT